MIDCTANGLPCKPDKITTNVYPSHGRNIIPDGSFIAVTAATRAAIPLYMAGRNRRRDFGMDQRFRMAYTDADSPAVFHLATELALLSITHIDRGRDRMDVFIKHCYIMPGDHHYLCGAQ